MKLVLLFAMLLPSLASASSTEKAAALKELSQSTCIKSGVLCDYVELNSSDEHEIFSSRARIVNFQSYLSQAADQLRDLRRSKGLPQSQAELISYENSIVVELEIRSFLQTL